MPRFLKLPGHLEELTPTNTVNCRVSVRNVAPTGFLRWFRLKGRVSAKNVRLKLVMEREGHEKQVLDLLWLLQNNPMALPEIGNDGEPVPVYFLRIDLEGHYLFVPTGPNQMDVKPIPHGKYKLGLVVGQEKADLGTFKLPEDLMALAQEYDNAVWAEENGGYAVYVEKSLEGIQMQCKGTIDDARILKLRDDYMRQHNVTPKIIVNGNPWIQKGSVTPLSG